jgi:hypothetical protein
VIKYDTRMTTYLAWGVRIVLLVLYVPVQILLTIAQSARRLDLWASAVITQTGQAEIR